jgi:hypothetical protein
LCFFCSDRKAFGSLSFDLEPNILLSLKLSFEILLEREAWLADRDLALLARRGLTE